MADESTGAESRIVVGVDGSESSKAALAWAVRQAELTGAVVDAVTAWQIPAYYGFAVAVDGPDFEQIATTVLHDAIKQAQDVVKEAGSKSPGVTIKPIVLHENAATALLHAAKGAELLVVGSRGHAGFTEAMLGSVGQYCMHHAECPVVVVRR